MKGCDPPQRSPLALSGSALPREVCLPPPPDLPSFPARSGPGLNTSEMASKCRGQPWPLGPSQGRTTQGQPQPDQTHGLRWPPAYWTWGRSLGLSNMKWWTRKLRRGLGIQVLPSGEGCQELLANMGGHLSHLKTMANRGGGRVLFQGPSAQGTRYTGERGLGCNPSLIRCIKCLIVSHSQGAQRYFLWDLGLVDRMEVAVGKKGET